MTLPKNKVFHFFFFFNTLFPHTNIFYGTIQMPQRDAIAIFHVKLQNNIFTMETQCQTMAMNVFALWGSY